MKYTTPKGKFICISEIMITSVYYGLLAGFPDECFKQQIVKRDKDAAAKHNAEETITVIVPEDKLPTASISVWFDDYEEAGCIIFYSELKEDPIQIFLSILDEQDWKKITKPFCF